MRTTSLFLWLSMTVLLTIASTTFGQASFLTRATATVSASESTGNLSADNDHDDDPNESLSSAEAQASVESRGFVDGADSGPIKNLRISASATAGIATLGVSLNGIIEEGEGDQFLARGGEINGSATAFWQDTMTIFDGSLDLGAPLAVTTRTTIRGGLLTLAGNLPSRKECPNCPTIGPHVGIAEVGLFLQDHSSNTLNFGDDDGVLKIGEATSGNDVPTLELPPESIDVQHLVVNGEPYTIGFGLSVGGEARAGFTILAVINADYSRTLNWGGITSVVDMATGEEVQGWTVSSASGFDYSKPFGVPEPSSILLLASGLCARLALGRRRRSTVGSE